ncbi:MAG: RnfH family protein [Gammaproteobacteria bacterium]|nr:RnfH family protein [Gammaproteobacteria bacterium]
MQLLEIEVVYALPDHQRLISIKVPAGINAREALCLSGLGADFPELDVESCPLGVFGKEVAADYLLADGDRLEAYRPLINDPRESRRVRAMQK